MARGRISPIWFLTPSELAHLMRRIIRQRAYLGRYVPHRAPPVQTYHAVVMRKRRLRGLAR